MLRLIFSFILAAMLLTGALVALQAMPVDSSQALSLGDETLAVGVTLVSADDQGISFILKTSQVESSAEGMLSDKALNTAIQEPGAPELPYFSTYIAIPPEALVSIDVYQEDTHLLSGISVNAVAEPVLAGGSLGPDSTLPVTAVSPQPASRIPDPIIFATDALYPQQVYQLSEPIYFRDMRLVKLDLYPVQYNPLRQELQQTEQMRVDIRFENARLENLQPAPSKNDTYQSSIADMILNFNQGKAWRSLPLSEQGPQLNSLAETAVSIPLGTASYKIKIDKDGIYDITGADLAAAGMIITDVNPAKIQMMSRGEDVAYKFIKVGGNNGVLENNDIIRFYGESVNTTRYEKQYLTHNIYWLWANGTATLIADVGNSPGATAVTTFKDSITREDERYFFTTWTNQWDEDYSNNAWNDFPNEADSWYWDYFTSAGTKTYTVNLPDPVINSGTTATYTIELMTREDRVNYDHQIDSCLNLPTECTQRSWAGHRNVNIVQTVPAISLISGNNIFTITFSGSAGIKAYLNRITVDYLRTLKAQDDQLFFTDEVGGRAMKVQDFSESDIADILVWDITSSKKPTQILLDPDNHINGNNGRYTYTIGINSNNAQNYIATTTANILTTTNKISQYTAPTNLEPTGGADWIAISYSDFLPEANRLAAHRRQDDFGEFKTHVVDINDVINVYGNGLATPVAINTYLKNAVQTWSTKPSYVVLVGNATISPRNLVCTSGCIAGWDNNATNFVLTDLQFQGRIQGLIPSDNPLVFLFGENGNENDLIPDMAIGRITSENITQTTSIVNKIIRYEENLIAQKAAKQKQRILFLADFPDPAAGDPAFDGSFCRTNKEKTGLLIPSDYEQVHLCIEDYATESDFNPDPFMEAIKEETYEGVTIMNYRGHGAVQHWGSPVFWEASSTISDGALKDTWANNGKPVIIISADCQDGYFALPGYSVISERFLVMGDLAGSAAHWGSTGFGYDHEHTVLLEGFYRGLFDHDLIALGDAINYAKLHFMQSGSYSESEIYSFNLQGDPATMAILPPDSVNNVFLPMITK